MRKKSESMEGILWAGFTLLTAAALCVSGARQLLGAGRFAYWHLPTLAMGVFFTAETLSLRQRAWIRLTARHLKKAAGIAILIVERLVFRAARGLAALFRGIQNKQIQTQP